MTEFSVVIPTLQRSSELRALVDACIAHPRVLEVLIVNNAPAPLAWDSPKVRILQQAENIFVNPAWNLGVAEARGEMLAIINDDVLFDPALFDAAAEWLSDPAVGVVGADFSCYSRTGEDEPHLGGRIYRRPYGFGVVMFMRRDKYVPIPAPLKIYAGDDWLVHAVRGARTFHGAALATEMSTTSSESTFSARLHGELAWKARNFWRYGPPERRILGLLQWLKYELRPARTSPETSDSP